MVFNPQNVKTSILVIFKSFQNLLKIYASIISMVPNSLLVSRRALCQKTYVFRVVRPRVRV